MLWNFRGDFAKIKKNPVKKNDDETKKWTMLVSKRKVMEMSLFPEKSYWIKTLNINIYLCSIRVYLLIFSLNSKKLSLLECFYFLIYTSKRYQNVWTEFSLDLLHRKDVIYLNPKATGGVNLTPTLWLFQICIF